MLRFRFSVLVLTLLAACANGPDYTALKEAADVFGTEGDIERRGGIWKGFAEPPAVISGSTSVYPGSDGLLVGVDRSTEFPVVSDLRAGGTWSERKSVDLDLIAELRSGGSLWTITTAADGIQFSQTAGGTEIVLPSSMASPDRFVVTPEAAIALDSTQGDLSIARADAADAPVYETDLGHICAASIVGKDLMFSGSTGAHEAGCDELWRVGADGVVRVLGGLGTDVAGVGFADDLPLVLNRVENSCDEEPCEVAASVLAPDGAVLRDLGPVPLSSRGSAVIGEVQGVPFVFSGTTSVVTDQEVGSFPRIGGQVHEVITEGVAQRIATDGSLFDGEQWVRMRPFPLARPQVNEPLEAVIASDRLYVFSDNAMGFWEPDGQGSSWKLEDLYTWPLYVATESDCLNLRSRPSLQANVIKCVDRGSEFWSDGAHIDSDGEKWISVLLPGTDLRGWVAERYLSGVSPDEPAEYYCA